MNQKKTELELTISSRTPEGVPNECPLCGANTRIEFSDPPSDAPCPVCGCLVWRSTEILQLVVNRCESAFGVDPNSIHPDSRFFDDLGTDSLDIVEFTMELEEEFDVNIPDEVAGRLHTVGDVVRYIQAHGSD